MKHVASVVSRYGDCACIPRDVGTRVGAKWGRLASPRLVGLGKWPRGHRLCVDVCDLLLESVFVV